MTNQEIIQSCIEAQHIYCNVNEKPEFAPPNGRCWSCGRNIYNPSIEGHYDIHDAMTTLITGCPYCNRTYCD